MPEFDIVYYCDSFPEIGNGHLARGISIIRYLLENTSLKIAISGLISENALKFISSSNLKEKIHIDTNRQYFHCKISILDTMFIPGDADYIDEKLCAEIKSKTRKLVVISGGLHPLLNPDIDVLIDHFADIEPKNVNEHTMILKGFEYIPVSNDLLAISSNGGNSLLCLIGGSENTEGLEILLNCLVKNVGEKLAIDFVLSPHYPDAIKHKLIDNYSHSNIIIHQNLISLNNLFDKAGFVITTYGNSTYESLMLQKITFTVAYRNFQYEYGAYLEKKGLTINLGFINDIAIAKLKILNDVETIEKLKTVMKNKFQNSGLHRIADFIKTQI